MSELPECMAYPSRTHHFVWIGAIGGTVDGVPYERCECGALRPRPGAVTGGAGMRGNAFQVVIELPKSDGFHTVNDRHVARIIQDRLREFLNGPGGLTSGACTVRIEPVGD